MAKAFHFLLRRGSVILHPAVPPAMARADWPVACQRPAKERGSHRIVAAVSFAARSLPGIDPCRFQIDLVTVAVGLFDPVVPDHSVDGFVVVAAVYFDFAVYVVCLCLV